MRVASWLLLSVLSAGAHAQGRHVLPLQGGAPVKGAPFTAVRTLDYEPAEDSSDAVPVHGEEKIWRDSDGRTRSEIRYGDQIANIYIMDLPGGVSYRWTAGDTVVRSSTLPPPKTPVAAPRPQPELPADAPLIEGMKTRHEHTVTGSETARKTVESWYSPELHLAMLTIIDEPGVGKTTYRFQHVVLGEPDPALFRVPAGFTMNDVSKPPPAPVQVATGSEDSAATSSTAPRPAYMDDPKFQKALAEAKNPRQMPQDQLEDWKHANKIAHGECEQCLHQMVLLQMKTSAWKDAVASTRQLETLTADPVEKSYARVQRGYSLMQYNYGSPKPDQLTEADALFKQVLAVLPKTRDAVFEDGRALAMLGKYDEAKAAFEHYVDMVPASDKLRMRAEHFSEDPHLATLAMAPPFRLVTSDGQQMQLDDMNGKVVLIDFWATWCGPCKETLPEIQRIAKEYANDPMLVVISVSSDADANAWRAFVQKNNMNWPQYRDANGAMSAAYGVTSIPRFFSIDTNGTLKSQQVGSDADVRGMVADLVKKAHKAEAQRAKATDKSASQSGSQ
jgi:thiol-disulfide isomerase/thioredoxin